MITDLNYLKTMSGNDPKFISEMIDLFREQVDEYSEQMPRLLADKAYADLSKLAHKAKSSVAVMGMTGVADMLKELEILANEAREVEQYPHMVAEFLEQCSQALVELDDLQS